MSSVRDSINTVNAAATAIVAAESRVQPSVVQKRRWGSCWSVYWCFGSYKHSKRIGHAVIASEPPMTGVVAPISENRNQSSSIVLPFIAPPSSPASFYQSEPSSATQSPAGLLSLSSLSVHVHSPCGTAPIFTIGPYAHETQLVSPPVFSTFTTEPSTASFTPPPEPVQITTPSSPEVPFAQLLSSSLAQTKRNSRTSLKHLSQYEFQPYQYPGSPGSHVKSPGSAVSTSGTSSPFPDKCPIMGFRAGEATKFLGYEHFPSYKWDSRLGSGSLTPNGWGSRLGSGTVTPNGGISRLGSGTMTPNGGVSRLGSGSLTPNGGEPQSQDTNLLENQFSEVASLANSDHESQNNDAVVGHRVSFELHGDNPTCIVSEPVPSHRDSSSDLRDAIGQVMNMKDFTIKNTHSYSQHFSGENRIPGTPLDVECEELLQEHPMTSLCSSKDFNFNNSKGEVVEKPCVKCEWWTNEKATKRELGPQKSWSFFPMLQSEAS